MIKRFDLVMLKSIRRVSWLSGPAGRPASPKGTWVVVAGVDEDKVLLAKDETLIQIPKEDVIQVATYDIGIVMNEIRKVRTAEDVAAVRPLLEKTNEKQSKG